MIRSFRARQADDARRDVLETITLTERLLVQILIELMELRAHRDMAEVSGRLKAAGLSAKQVAALLDTTPASLAVTERRKARDSQPVNGPAIRRGSDEKKESDDVRPLTEQE